VKRATYLGDGLPARAVAACPACGVALAIGAPVCVNDCDYRHVALLFCSARCYLTKFPHDPVAEAAAAAEQPKPPAAHAGDDGPDVW
jgi:hypothetical protein